MTSPRPGLFGGWAEELGRRGGWPWSAWLAKFLGIVIALGWGSLSLEVPCRKVRLFHGLVDLQVNMIQ
jgi:hypothetical protein